MQGGYRRRSIRGTVEIEYQLELSLDSRERLRMLPGRTFGQGCAGVFV